MQYTLGQLWDTVGLSKETLRHWKRVVPALSAGRRHSPSFFPGDVLASATLRRLTEACGVRIGHLTGVATKVFAICNQMPRDLLASRVLVVNLPERDCEVLQDVADIRARSATLVRPLEPTVAALQNDLFQSAQPVRSNRVPPVTESHQKHATRGPVK